MCWLSVACANKVALTGGSKDTQAPVMLQANPPSMTTGVRPAKISFLFNEFIQLDQTMDIMISPSMNVAPKYSANGRNLVVELDPQALQDSTTYSISFANSIVDLNERNPLSGFTYVFSTGSDIDTASLSGKIDLSGADLGENKVVVGLYKNRNNLVDSAKPYYVCHADKEGNFALHYVKHGRYFVVAYEDINRDFKLQLSERMGFLSDNVSIAGNIDSLSLELSAHSGIIPTYTVTRQGRPYVVVAASKPIPKPTAYTATGKNLQVVMNDTRDTLYIKHKPHGQYLVLQVPGFLPDTIKFSSPAARGATATQVATPLLAETKQNGAIVLKAKEGSHLDSLVLSAIKLLAGADTIMPDSVVLTIRNTVMVYPPTHIIGKEVVVMLDSAGVFADGVALGAYATGAIVAPTINPLQGISFQVVYPVGDINLGVALKDKTGTVVRRKYLVKQNTFGFNKLPEGEYSLELYVDDNGNGIWDPADFVALVQPEQRYKFGPYQVMAGWEQQGNQLVLD
ncbi:MAG: Ig-like domain-containing protein [Bacteroidetes bacterium]|nr:Ig-like domain-containing protein [Bacteroidota bacterium]